MALADKRYVTQDEANLTKGVRMIDLLLFGPLLIYAGVKGINKTVKYLLISLAVLTIVYNAYYFLKYENQKESTLIKS